MMYLTNYSWNHINEVCNIITLVSAQAESTDLIVPKIFKNTSRETFPLQWLRKSRHILNIVDTYFLYVFVPYMEKECINIRKLLEKCTF